MRRKTFLKIVELQTEQAERHLNEVRSIHREMRAFKHDYHNHLQTLRGHIASGDIARALGYIDELDARLKSVDTLIKTGNVSADAILSSKIAQAKAAGIAVTVKANIPDVMALSDVELSIVLGNLLDNAIEACALARGERFIRLFIALKGSMLYFSMLNSAAEKQIKRGSLFKTRKAGLHGFGLKRAQSIIEEHGGWIKYNSEDGAFTTEFLVPTGE